MDPLPWVFRGGKESSQIATFECARRPAKGNLASKLAKSSAWNLARKLFTEALGRLRCRPMKTCKIIPEGHGSALSVLREERMDYPANDGEQRHLRLDGMTDDQACFAIARELCPPGQDVESLYQALQRERQSFPTLCDWLRNGGLFEAKTPPE